MNYLLIGKLIKPVGLKGEIKTAFYVDDLDELGDYTAFYRKDPKIKGAYQEIKLENIRLRDGTIIVQVEGCHDRNQSEMLQGIELFVDESELPKTKKNEYYIKDLLDMEVYQDDKVIGKVDNIIEIAAKTMIIIKFLDGKSVVAPFAGHFVESVDVVSRRVIVQNLEELI